MNSIVEKYKYLGGVFLTPTEEIVKKIKQLKGFLFDWDGVFNTGVKSINYTSTFSETDSMGINLLRFSYWLDNQTVPFVGIITGQHNETAFELAKREHFDAVYSTFKHKNEALLHIKQKFKITPSKMLFVFDDVLDLSAAENSGIAILVNRKSSPLFHDYVVKNKLADYITYSMANENAIREICELIMGLKGSYEQVLKERINFTENYQKYIEERNKIESKFYHKSDKKIIETTI